MVIFIRFFHNQNFLQNFLCVGQPLALILPIGESRQVFDQDKDTSGRAYTTTIPSTLSMVRGVSPNLGLRYMYLQSVSEACIIKLVDKGMPKRI